MKTFLLAGLCLSLTSLAHSRSFDGCYQLLSPGVMYPAVCLSGTTEEGIGGANVRLAVFGTNTDKLIECMRSTSLVLTSSKMEFIVQGKKELVLQNFSANGTSGDAIVGRTNLKFVRLSENHAKVLKDSAYRGNCL